MKIPLSKIKADPAVQVRMRLNDETIERYMEILDQLPPIIVCNVDGKLILVDGFHRRAAAERLGRSEIEAETRQGTRNDALEYAIKANSIHGLPLAREEYKAAVRTLHHLHPKWGHKQIAKALNRGEKFVRNVIKVDKMRAMLRNTSLSDSYLLEIARVPKELQEDLVEATEKRSWTYLEMQYAIREIKNEGTPPERKQVLLKGEDDPIAEKNGKPALLAETVQRRMAEGIGKDKVVAWAKTQEALGILAQIPAKEVIDELDEFACEKLIRNAPKSRDYLKELERYARERLELWGKINKIRGD